MYRFVAFLLLASASASAQPPDGARPGRLQHEVGEMWGWADYPSVLQRAMSDASPLSLTDPSQCSPLAQMILTPSFQVEQFSSLCGTRGGAVAVSGVPARSLYGAMYVDRGGPRYEFAPDSARAVPVRWDTAPLDSATTSLVYRAMRRAVRSAAYPEPSGWMQVDGELMYVRSHDASAVSHNADLEPVADAVRTLGLRVMSYARGESTEAELRTDAEALDARLDAQGL